MAQKKETQTTKKPGVKVQDLAPKKDAKGGAYLSSGGGKPVSSTKPTLSGTGTRPSSS